MIEGIKYTPDEPISEKKTILQNLRNTVATRIGIAAMIATTAGMAYVEQSHAENDQKVDMATMIDTTVVSNKEITLAENEGRSEIKTQLLQVVDFLAKNNVNTSISELKTQIGDITEKSLDWFNTLSKNEQAVFVLSGLFFVMPTLATGKAVVDITTEKKNGKSWEESIENARSNFIDNSHSQKTVSSLMAGVATLNTAVLGRGMAEYGISFEVGVGFAAMLLAYAASERDKEKAHTFALQQLATIIVAHTAGVFLGDNLTGEHLRIADMQWGPNVLLGAAVAGGELWVFNRTSAQSRDFIRDLKNLHLDLTGPVSQLFGNLESRQRHNIVRKMITQIAQDKIMSDMLAEGGTIEEAFNLLAADIEEEEIKKPDIPLEDTRLLVVRELLDRVNATKEQIRQVKEEAVENEEENIHMVGDDHEWAVGIRGEVIKRARKRRVSKPSISI